MGESGAESDAWQPGLASEIPPRLMPLATLYRAENSTVGYAEAREAAEYCGLKPRDMVATRLERLILHEILVRVTADLTVPDGPNYEDLGISLRAMAARIEAGYVAPRMEELRDRFEAFRHEAEALIRAILDADVPAVAAPPPAAAPRRGMLGSIFGRRADPPVPAAVQPPEFAALTKWGERLSRAESGLERACLESLATVVGGIVGRRGRLLADRDVVARLALNMVGNGYGSQLVGEWIEPIIRAAVAGEGYRVLPVQEKPLFLNVKGSSAAGKSTIRPAQRALAGKLGVPWEDFALISPDYWRKHLLDYESLGDDHKYAAMLTGQELEIIDRKLDRHMEAKAARRALPHLLLDRFRFDSFDTSQDSGKTSQLLTRFGDTVFLFFVITPPAETVERSWKRGLQTGRFKAVDDLLYHNIEAYTGMPNLFFSTVLSSSKTIHFEFLDNGVPLGERPRTIAFGRNRQMTILDLARLNDIDRFRNVNVAATRPEDVLPDTTKDSFAFLGSCLRRIPEVILADHATATVYGAARAGSWVYRAPAEALRLDPDGFDMRCLEALGWGGAPDAGGADPPRMDVEAERRLTLGAWGEGAVSG